MSLNRAAAHPSIPRRPDRKSLQAEATTCRALGAWTAPGFFLWQSMPLAKLPQAGLGNPPPFPGSVSKMRPRGPPHGASSLARPIQAFQSTSHHSHQPSNYSPASIPAGVAGNRSARALVSQPWRELVVGQQHRHPVVDFGNEVVGLGDDHRAGLDLFAGRTFVHSSHSPAAVKSGGGTVNGGEIPRLFPGERRLPLVSLRRE
jgi:hypothetical protein